MNPLLTAIILVLRRHVGRDQVISAKAIALEIGLRLSNSDREVREILSEAIEDGSLEELEVPICAIPGQGYFLASDIDEAQAYADLLSLLATEAARKSRNVTALFKSMGLRLQSKNLKSQISNLKS